MDWRFFATRLNGDGTETLLADYIPFTSVSLTEEVSAPSSLQATLAPEMPWLIRDGIPIFVPWSTAIYAEYDGVIRHCTLLKSMRPTGSVLSLEGIGLAAYIDGMPWTNSTAKYYKIDPALVIQRIWATAQAHPFGNINLAVDTIKTPYTVGTIVKEVKNKAGTVTTEAVDEPLLLADYATPDLGQVVADMLTAGDIDYRERHSYTASGQVSHRLELGHPRLGRRRTDITFDTRINCAVLPELEVDADDYASEVLVLGAGEGEKMVRAHARNPNVTRLRRVALQEAKHIGRKASAVNAAAARVRLLNTYHTDVSSITLIDHSLAPAFAWEVGDEVPLVGPSGWGGELSQFVRILSHTYDPSSQTISLGVIRADKI